MNFVYWRGCWSKLALALALLLPGCRSLRTLPEPGKDPVQAWPEVKPHRCSCGAMHKPGTIKVRVVLVPMPMTPFHWAPTPWGEPM